MFHFKQGRHNTQGHKAIPDGHYEEEQGRKGFFGAVSHLIKAKPSTRWNKIEGNLRPRLFDLVKIPTGQNDQTGKWQRMLFNNDIGIYYHWEKANSKVSSKAFRNADGESLYFCHAGEGVVLTEFGLLKFNKGTYIAIPKCVTHTFHATADCTFLVIESRNSSFREPDRGVLGRHGFYDTEALKAPDLTAQQEFYKKHSPNVTEVIVKRDNEFTQFGYAEDYYDTVGWKGDFFPFTLHVNDLMPIVSARVHLPPSVHSTFIANNFVVCTFLPRPLETDADALKVPFYHQNIDYDEVIFYHDGNFFSRDNLHAGMITLHPAGFPHGPHPKAVANSKTGTKTHTDEYAVMVDCWNKLQIDPEFSKVEVKEYWQSWSK